MSCIVSRLLTDVTPARLRQLPRTGRRGQGSGAGGGRPPLVLLRVPPGLTSESIAPCTCIRMVFRTFKRIRICIRVHLGNFVPDSDIAAGCHIVAIRRQLASATHPSGCMHEYQISPTVTLDNYGLPLSDFCDLRHNKHAHLHNERRADGVPGWDDRNEKKCPGRKPAPGSSGAGSRPPVG